MAGKNSIFSTATDSKVAFADFFPRSNWRISWAFISQIFLLLRCKEKREMFQPIVLESFIGLVS
jgi:hypothetical protein